MRALLQHATYDPALQAVPAARGGEGSECREIGSDEIGQLCEAYVRDGFVHVRALVCPPAATAAVRALWSQMEGAVDGLQRGAPESWTTVGQWSGRVDDVAVLNCWSKGHLAVAAALSDAMAAAAASDAHPALPPATVLVQPHETMAINRFPEKEDVEWKWPGPHIDHGKLHMSTHCSVPGGRIRLTTTDTHTYTYTHTHTHTHTPTHTHTHTHTLTHTTRLSRTIEL